MKLPIGFDGDELVMIILILCATVLKLKGFNGESSAILTGASMYLFGKAIKGIKKEIK